MMTDIKIRKTSYLIIFAFLPVALLGLLPANKYIAQGMEGGVDCEGPLAVMMFSIPSFIVYGIGLVVFAKASLRAKKVKYILMLIICVGVISIITPNTISAIKENIVNSTESKSTCGAG